MKRQFLTIIVAVFCGTFVIAQQDAQYTQYMYNTQIFNPGYIGTTEVTELSIAHRSQWIGLKGAPHTSVFAVNAPLKKGLGVGGTVIRDVIGATEEHNVSVDLGYRLRLNKKWTMSLGIKGGVNLMNFDVNRLNPEDPNEANLASFNNSISPTAGGGVYLYSRKFYVGVSSPNLVQSEGVKNGVYTSVREQIHANLIVGYVFQKNRVKFKPAALIKYVNGAPANWHLSTNFLFNDRYSVGLGYQWKSNVGLLLGAHFLKRWFVGYSYDLNFSALRSYNMGAHELYLRVKLGDLINKRIISPRFF